MESPENSHYNLGQNKKVAIIIATFIVILIVINVEGGT